MDLYTIRLWSTRHSSRKEYVQQLLKSGIMLKRMTLLPKMFRCLLYTCMAGLKTLTWSSDQLLLMSRGPWRRPPFSKVILTHEHSSVLYNQLARIQTTPRIILVLIQGGEYEECLEICWAS